MGGRVTAARVAASVLGAAVWVAGILLLEGQAATIVFAAAFALALPAVLHLAAGEGAERGKAVALAVLLLITAPLAVLVFDEQDELALLIPVAMAGGIAGDLWDRRPRSSKQAR